MNDALRLVIRRLILGDSMAIRRVRDTIAQVAATRIAVLIEGPTGAGKELVAQALHMASGRSGKLVAVNICAIPDSMFEDTLFGHVRGAFTGAVNDNGGLIAEADHGTLFLDEISGLPLSLQAKLLRVVETRQFRAVGGRSDLASDFRVVSATNESIAGLEEERRFRSDLRHRLARLTIRVPSLSERAEDVPLLVDYFLRVDHGGALRVTPSALLTLQEYHWPGNVRELKSIVECAVALSDTGDIDCALVRSLLDSGRTGSSAVGHANGALLQALAETEWDVDAAARLLGVHRSTIYRRLRKLESVGHNAAMAACARSVAVYPPPEAACEGERLVI